MYNYKKKDLNMKRELDFLLSKTLSMFKYEGLPETIPQRELERQLQTKGYAFITKAKGKLYSFTGGLGGEPDPYGNPTQIVVTNPALDFYETLDLEKDGVLIRNDSMQNGIRHLLQKYIYMMNESEISMVVNSFNARFPTLLSAGDDRTRESAELYLKKVIDGDLGVIAENRLFEGINAQSAGGAGSMFTQLIEYQQYLKATLYNELGLEMNNNMKRERLTEDEVNITDIIYPFVDNMRMNREKGIEEVNSMFSKEIEVGFDSIWAKHDPSEALDEEMLYDEVDMYLDMFLGPQQAQEEDILPDVSEEELQSVLTQLQELSEGEDNANESGTSDGNSEGGSTSSSEGLGDAESSRGDTGDSGGTGDDDNEPGDDNAGPSDGPDSEPTGDDARDGSDSGDGSSDSTDSADDTATETDGVESDKPGSDGVDGGVTDEDSSEPSDEDAGEHSDAESVRVTLKHGVSTTVDADTETEQTRTDNSGQSSDVEIEIEINVEEEEEDNES